MRDAPAFPRSETARVAFATARHDQVERLRFIFASGLLASATILVAATAVLTRLA